ncbi:unnamed protein product [Albugo candida]|nr:unnamed protein product [Albugo candida]|eukprot:CCI48668.1 unnamed protein product [Albugo candida]
MFMLQLNAKESLTRNPWDWWKLFSASYTECVESLISPPRPKYLTAQLGPNREEILHSSDSSHRNKCIVREDLRLRNTRNEWMECSFWTTNRESEDPIFEQPCIIYVHGISSSRLEALYIRHAVLGAGFSFFAFDCAGSGVSEGKYISFGYNEKNDLRTVVEYLYCVKSVPKVGIWGRCMGGASTLMFLREATRFRFFTVHVKASEFATLPLYYCHATKRLLCPTAMLTRSCSTLLVSWNAQMERAMLKKKKNSRLVTDAMLEILSVNGEDVRGQDPSTVRHITSKFTKTSNNTLLIRGIQSLAKHEEHENSFIFAIALDSVYCDLSRMLVDMLREVLKSANKRSLRFPPGTNTAASKIIAHSISKVAGFSVGDVKPIHALENTHLPCLFVHCSEVDFVRPEYTIQMFEEYSSKHKMCLSFDGSHHQNRPQFILDQVCSHFQTQFARSVE